MEDNYQRDHYLPFQVNLLKCLAMWPLNFKKILPSSLHFLNFYLNGVFYMVMSGNLLQMAVLQMKTLYDAWDSTTSMNDVSDFIVSSIIYSGGFLMCVYFQLRYRANKEMVHHLNKTLVSRSSRGLTYVTVGPCYNWARKLSIWWTVACVLGTIHYGIYPVLVRKRILPINIQYPFDTQSSPNFEILYFVQFFGQLQIGAIYSVYGTMWISVIILICGQFDILFCSVKNVLWSGMIRSGESSALEYLKRRQEENKIPQAKAFSEYYNSVEVNDVLQLSNHHQKPSSQVESVTDSNLFSKYDKEVLVELRKAVLLHQNILRLSAMLEEFFYPFMLGKISVCSILACFLAYLSSSGLGSIMKVVTLLEYLILVFAELLLNTYFPTILLHQVGYYICVLKTSLKGF